MVHHPTAQTPLSDIAFKVIIFFKKASSWHLSRDGRFPEVGGRGRECSGRGPEAGKWPKRATRGVAGRMEAAGVLAKGGVSPEPRLAGA